MMMNGKPKGEIDPNVLEELVQFLQQRGEAPGDSAPGAGAESPAVEVEIEAKPPGTHTMPDGSTMADSEMAGAACPHCGKPY